MGIVQDLVEALSMAEGLPFLIALPVYGIAYALFVWAVAMAVCAIAKAVMAVRRACK